MAVVLERLISIERRKKSVYVTVSTFYTLLRQTPRQIKMALSEKVKNEIPRTPDLKIVFFFSAKTTFRILLSVMRLSSYALTSCYKQKKTRCE